LQHLSRVVRLYNRI